jgi:hypothetical protein
MRAHRLCGQSVLLWNTRSRSGTRPHESHLRNSIYLIEIQRLNSSLIGTPDAIPRPEKTMNYSYPRSVRVFRLSRGMQIVLEVAVAMSAALFMSYLILHGVL